MAITEADFTELLPYAWRYVTADTGIRSLVTGPTYIGSAEYSSGIVGKDPDPGAYEYDVPNSKFGWIFRNINDPRPPRNVESSGKAAIMLSQFDFWSNQVRHHTTKFPILTVTIFADPTRDGAGNPIAQDAEDKVRRAWKEIDRLFHDAANEIHEFSANPSDPDRTRLRVVSSVEGAPLSILEIPEGDGAVRGTVRYDITL